MDYITLYYTLEKPPIKFLRLFVFLALLGWWLMDISVGFPQTLSGYLFSFVVMWEIFFHFKLSHLYPTQTLSSNPKDPHIAATMPTLAANTITNPKHFVEFLVHQKDIQFMLARMLIMPKEIQSLPIDHEALFKQALTYAKATHTNYIDTPHMLAAYLMLTEPQTKLLFSKELKETDLQRIIVWTQLAYPQRQTPQKHFQIIGEGYGETLTAGWTYETKKYTLDWTTEALLNEPLMFDRIEIFEQMIGILSQPQHNNVLLIGEVGCGKHMMIDKIAYESYNGHVPHNLQHKRVLTLMVSSLLAGIQDSSELQERLQTVLAELTHATALIAIPEIQDILGSDTFQTDLSGVLLPYLQNGAIPIIATMTPENYKRYMEHNSLKDVFTPITFPNPDTEILFGMLFLAVLSLEKTQHVHFSYLSVVKAAELANRFDPLGTLPGSAVKLLEATGTALLVSGKNSVTAHDIEQHIETTTHVQVGTPDQQEADLLMHLENVLHEKVIGQEDAISAIAEGMRRMRSNLSSTTKPISFLFLGPTGVGKTETAKTLADIYFKGQTNMRSQVSPGTWIRLDMSEYSGPDGLRRLLGSSSGEGDGKGELTEKVFDHPSSLILLDEFEKANPTILDLFLQVLDDGRLTDNKGKTVSFQNCIIIATSNAGSEFIRQHISRHSEQSEESDKILHSVQDDKKFHEELLNHLQTNHLFKPELLNRFDEVVVFKPLDHSQVITITTMLLQTLVTKLQQQDITISFDTAVIEKIANESFDPELGARPIQRYIQANLDDIIAKKKLEGTLTRGSKAVFVLDQNGTITIT